MNDTSLPAFDGASVLFADYGTTLRGYVRYQLTQRNLEPYLKKALHVLDVGGGSGPDAAWLASLGHQVTIVEPSAEQRAHAQRRFNFFLSDEERARITMIPGTIDDIPADQRFDLVTVHGVAMFQARPTTLLKAAITRVKPGGIISIVEKGYAGAIARSIRENDHDNLRMLLASHRCINHLKQDVYATKPDELSKLLEQNGCEVLEWFGIRLITDEQDIQVNTINKQELAEILSAEYEQGRDPSIRGQGQLLHFIARRKK
jgi:protein-L-isoaspartate O-methyltransferase